MARRADCSEKMSPNAWRVHPRKRVLQTEGFDVCMERFFEIRDGVFFRFAFSIEGDVADAGRKPAFFKVRDDLYREFLHHGPRIPQHCRMGRTALLDRLPHPGEDCGASGTEKVSKVYRGVRHPLHPPREGYFAIRLIFKPSRANALKFLGKQHLTAEVTIPGGLQALLLETEVGRL